MKCGACQHTHLGYPSTPLVGHPKRLYSTGWHLQYKTDWAPLNPVNKHGLSKIAGPLDRKGRPIRQGGI
jgi:hypothetical protein